MQTAKIRLHNAFPLEVGLRAVGEISDHPRQAQLNGQYQMTSRVVSIGNGSFETEHTRYEVIE